MTFSFYRIREMDVIVAVSGSNADALKWTKVTEESDTFQERIHFILNPGTARELSRLRDLIALRFDGNSPRLRPPPIPKIRRVERPPSTPLIIDYRRADQPCCDPLPAEWALPAPADAERKTGAPLAQPDSQ
jgi:hypothetical protein